MATTANMQITLPVVGVTLSPRWAKQLVDALGVVDDHDHSETNGVKITNASINIDSDLDFNNNSLKTVASLSFISSTSADTGSQLYTSNGELYYLDGAGNRVQITSGGALIVTSSKGILGDYVSAHALVSYNDTSKKYSFYDPDNNTVIIIVKRMDVNGTLSGDITFSGTVTIPTGTSLYALLLKTTEMVLGGSGTASFNLKFHRPAAATFEVSASDTTVVDGTPLTSPKQFLFAYPQYTIGTMPNKAIRTGALTLNTTYGTLGHAITDNEVMLSHEVATASGAVPVGSCIEIDSVGKALLSTTYASVTGISMNSTSISSGNSVAYAPLGTFLPTATTSWVGRKVYMQYDGSVGFFANSTPIGMYVATNKIYVTKDV